MPIYTPRFTEPSTTDKNWLSTSAAGYNKCVVIKNGSCLPNCVGYVYGRWRELLNENHKLCTYDAENWYYYTNDGYKRGNTPKLGAIICWKQGKPYNRTDGSGHLAIVEQINKDDSIVISQSAFNGTRFKTLTLKKPYIYKSGFVLQGFIYPPVEYESAKADITVGDLVCITGTRYYNDIVIPLWVKQKNWYVSSISGDRVVINKSQDGRNSINSAIKASDLKKVELSYFEYTVLKGDCLWNIAKKFLGSGSRYKEIIEFNNMSNARLYTGVVLKIPQ